MGRTPVAALVALALLAGCGHEEVDVNSYTCGDFKESFRDTDDTSAGNFIRQITKKVERKPGTSDEALQQQVGAAITIACGRKPESYKPANPAIALVNAANSGKLPKQPKTTTDDDTSKEPGTTTEETTTGEDKDTSTEETTTGEDQDTTTGESKAP